MELQECIPLDPIIHHLFKPQLIPGVTGNFCWKLPDLLDHETHLKKIEEFLHKMKPNFDSMQNNQKNSLRSFLYVYAGIFGSKNMQVKSLDISMGSELTIGAGTGKSVHIAVRISSSIYVGIQLCI